MSIVTYIDAAISIAIGRKHPISAYYVSDLFGFGFFGSL